MQANMNIRPTSNTALPHSIRIAVIDNHPMFREGAVRVLTEADGIEVVGQGTTATDAVAIARERIPDVMLLDLNLPGGGANAATNIAGVCPNVRIIALTASENEEDVISALKLGVRGYILKGSTGDEMIKAVRAIFQSDCYAAPTLAARLLIKNGNGIVAVDGNQSDLSACQGKVFALVSQGMSNIQGISNIQGRSNKEVARSLKYTEGTIKRHITKIIQKFKVRNRVQATAWKFR